MSRTCRSQRQRGLGPETRFRDGSGWLLAEVYPLRRAAISRSRATSLPTSVRGVPDNLLDSDPLRIADGIVHTVPALLEEARIVLPVIRKMAAETFDDLVTGGAALARGGEWPVGELEVQQQPVLEAGVRQDHHDARRTMPFPQVSQPSFEVADRGGAAIVIEHAVDFVPVRILPQFGSRTLPQSAWSRLSRARCADDYARETPVGLQRLEIAGFGPGSLAQDEHPRVAGPMRAGASPATRASPSRASLSQSSPAPRRWERRCTGLRGSHAARIRFGAAGSRTTR